MMEYRTHTDWARRMADSVMARRPALAAMLGELTESVMRVRDPAAGVWFQVLDQGGRPGNYREASASCMICYAVAKGLRLGFLPEKWAAEIRRSWQGVIEQFVTVTSQGLVNLNKCCQVAGLGGKDRRDGTFAYYIGEPGDRKRPQGRGRVPAGRLGTGTDGMM